MTATSFWSDPLALPLYVGAASVAVLTSQSLLKSSAKWQKSSPEEPQNASETHTIADHVESHGGRTIFAFKAARLVSCLVLLSLSLVSLVLEETDQQEETVDFASHRRSRQVALCATYLYATVLAIVSLASSDRLSRTVIPHINAVLLFVFGVYFYRDILPLATYNLHPKDLSEGPILWAKISFLFTAGVAIPLLAPRKYIPLDPKNPTPEPNPEQTASILSLVLYFFLDKIVFLAYRIPHLSFEQLPPLADYDYAQYLKTISFPYLDAFAGKKRHVFFGIVWVYRWRILVMVIMCIIMALAPFLSPIGLNRLLSYLENPDEEQTLKPWFWCLFLLLGPLVHSLSFQWYIFVSTHIMANTTAIITQLVFEHALRIRVKAETGNNKPKDDEPPAKKEKTANLHGKMTNLVTTDLSTINEARNILFLIILVPVQIVGAIFFLYQVLSWSAFVGMGVMVALFPLPGYVAKLQQTFQKKTMQKTDARVQTVTETMNVLRMIKMFGWEKWMDERIAEKREDELTWLWGRKLLDLANNTINGVIPVLTMLVTFGKLPHTLIAKQELSAAKVFSSMAVFDMLRNQLWFTFYCISTSVNGKVSLDRLEEFLQTTELLDSFTSKDTPEFIVADEPASDVVGFRDATFAWSNDEADGTLTPSSRRFLLKIEGELFFKPHCVNLIVGPTGSGKTSLLMALLGEMHFKPSSPSSWYNLPRGQGVAYAAQESWVQNDTIRNNIIFTSPVNEERYKKVLYQCALERDLELFDAGDQTEVGEKGLTLSGGQKARVTLARAIYSQAQIILLDDILAALDVHTAKWIVDKCLRGDLVQGRTVLLVTHNVALASTTAEFVVSISNDGRILSQGSISDAIARDENLAKEVQKDQEILENAEKEVDSQPVEATKKAGAGKLIVAEEIEIGRVSWSALNLFFTGMGGAYTPLFFSVLMGFLLLSEAFITAQTWYLGWWSSHYGQGVEVPALKYLGGFSLLLLGGILLAAAHFLFFTLGSFRASRTIHKQLVESVLSTTLRWLDVTPTSRIITRCTQDISAVDGGVPETLHAVLEITVAVLTKFFAVVVFAPLSFFGGILVGVIGGTCGRIYLASQLSVKREMSNAKAPVLAHFGATVAGLVSVRAYGAQDAMIQTSMNRINKLSRATRTFANLNRWITVRSDVLGGLFASTTAIYVVYFQRQRPFNALGFAEMILYWVRMYNMFEIQGNSLERLVQYTTIEQEPKPTKAGIPPAYWPSSGSLSVDNLSARYSPDGPKVLQDVSFNIKSGERVGVVGRTGSGKSSLTLSLLRCIFTEGEVYYDNIPTSTLNLDALRSNITIIPQVPELLVGTLRSNLDPFEQLDDATLNDALRASGLSALQDEMEEGRLTLDSEISAGGGNLSVGQRQIIALARAIVRGSKLMILDEATSAIDYKTDAVIQKSLRELSSDTTLFTVAHRLQTIMDADKIMVLDAGRVVEFDTPKTLLENKDGLLYALVEESGDKDVLYQMVRA